LAIHVILIAFFIAVVASQFIIVLKNALTQSSPVHSHFTGLPAEMDEIELYEQAQCIRIMLKAGADLSLNVDHGNFWITAFMQAVEYGSFVNKTIHSQL
jgi:hypothetical protein